MILSLRQRHRRIFMVIGVMLPLLFVVGMVARRAVPQPASLPPELTSETVTFTATDYERGDLFEKSSVQVRLWREQGCRRALWKRGYPCGRCGRGMTRTPPGMCRPTDG